jgi:hypothetical protein
MGMLDFSCCADAGPVTNDSIALNANNIKIEETFTVCFILPPLFVHFIYYVQLLFLLHNQAILNDYVFSTPCIPPSKEL